MPLTPEERAEVSRRNGAKSPGVKSPEGRRISRRNSLKAGVYARTLCLEDEDESAVQALRDAYHDSMDPQSPAEGHLVDECFHNDVSTRRYRRARKDALDRQARRALEQRRAQRQARVDQLRRDLGVDCAWATDELRQMSEGCAWLEGRYIELRDALDSRGSLGLEEFATFLQLTGISPVSQEPGDIEDWYRYELANLGSGAQGPSDPRVVAMLRPENRPAGLRSAPVERIFAGSQAACRADLREGALQLQIEWLAEQGARLRSQEDREVSELLDGCAVLNDPEEAKKFHRYATECASGFHRAHNALRAIARDRKKDAECEREGSSGDVDRGDRADTAEDAGTRGHAGVTGGAGGETPRGAASVPTRNEPGEEAGAAVETATRNEPSTGLETEEAGALAETGSGTGAAERTGAVGTRNEPSTALETRETVAPGAGREPGDRTLATPRPGTPAHAGRGERPDDGDCGPPAGGFWQARGLCGDQLGEALRNLRAEPPPGPFEGTPKAGPGGLYRPAADLSGEALIRACGPVLEMPGETAPNP